MQTLQQIVSSLTAILIALQTSVSGLPSAQVAQVTPSAALSLSPSSTSVNVNNTFTVNILLNTGGQSAYGVDVNKLRFNPAVLQVVDADAGTSGVQISPGSLMALTIINNIDNTAGTIQFSQIATPGSTYSGSGTVATVTFRAISAGSSSATFDFSLGSGTDSNVAGLGGDLLASVGSGSYTGVALDTTPPTISSISSSGVTTSGATVSWNTNEASDTQVEYGATTSYGSQTALNSSLVTSHSATLSGLSASTLYHYRVKSRDAAGNLSTSGDNTFTTQAPPDTTPPTISSVAVSGVTTSGATVSWNTNEASDTQVEYGATTSYGSQTALNSSLVTSHSATLSGLSASTLYHYRVKSRDAAGNLSTSGDNTFTTQAPPDTTPPTISSVAVSGVTTSGATVSWNTNEASDTQVEYGATTSYGSQTTRNPSLLTSHSATVSGLSPAATYHFRVKSRDSAGNLAMSSDSTFTTNSLPDTTAPSVPSGLSATPTSESQIQVSWNDSTDPAGSGQAVSGVASYRVFRDGVQVGTTASTAYLDTALSANTAYSYRVSAVDNAGNVSSQSSAVSATTPIFSLSVQRRIVLVPEGAPSSGRDVSGTVEFLDPSNLGNKLYQASITTDTLGRHTVDVPAGLLPTVAMRAVVSGYLSKIQSGVDLRNTTVLDVSFPTLPAGDFNDDQLINSLDFSYMNGKWSTSDALADLNRDSSVNSLDFAFLSNNWLQSGE